MAYVNADGIFGSHSKETLFFFSSFVCFISKLIKIRGTVIYHYLIYVLLLIHLFQY
jgi:hypothetical protein